MSDTYKVRIAPVPKGAFSSAEVYRKNDIVRYGSSSYIFAVDKAAGEWDASKVALLTSDASISGIADGGSSSQF